MGMQIKAWHRCDDGGWNVSAFSSRTQSTHLRFRVFHGLCPYLVVQSQYVLVNKRALQVRQEGEEHKEGTLNYYCAEENLYPWRQAREKKQKLLVFIKTNCERRWLQCGMITTVIDGLPVVWCLQVLQCLEWTLYRPLLLVFSAADSKKCPRERKVQTYFPKDEAVESYSHRPDIQSL